MGKIFSSYLTSYNRYFALGTYSSVALLSHFTSSEVRFLDLVFLCDAGCPGGQERLTPVAGIP